MILFVDACVRANSRTKRLVQQFDRFFETYNLEDGDGMYLAPENRVAVW